MASRSSRPRAAIVGRALAFLSACVLVAGTSATVSAAPIFSAKASVSPLVQYLNDSAGTTFTFTIDNTGGVSIGAVEISRPAASWTVTACPLAPIGWTTQRADTKCRYRSADGTADDIPGPGSSSAFRLTATVAPGTQNISGTWQVIVSKTRYYAGNVDIAPDAYLDDGLLNVCVITADSPLKTAEQALSFLVRRKLDEKMTRYFRGSQLSIRVPAATSMQVDGSIVKLEDYVCKSERDALRQVNNAGEVMVSYRFDAVPAAEMSGACRA